MTATISAQQQQRPSVPITPLARNPSKQKKKIGGNSPMSRQASTRTAALLNFDVPLHNVFPPSSATNAGAGHFNFYGKSQNSSIDLFVDQAANEMKSTKTTTQANSFQSRGKRTLAVGALAHESSRDLEAQRPSVNLKGKLSGQQIRKPPRTGPVRSVSQEGRKQNTRNTLTVSSHQQAALQAKFDQFAMRTQNES